MNSRCKDVDKRGEYTIDLTSKWEKDIVKDYRAYRDVINSPYQLNIDGETIVGDDLEEVLEKLGYIDRSCKYYQKAVVVYARRIDKNKNKKSIEECLLKKQTKYQPHNGEYYTNQRWSYEFKENLNSAGTWKRGDVLLEKTGNTVRRACHSRNKFDSSKGDLYLKEKLKDMGYEFLPYSSVLAISMDFNTMKEHLQYTLYIRDDESMLREAAMIEINRLDRNVSKNRRIKSYCNLIVEHILGFGNYERDFKGIADYVNPVTGKRYSSDFYIPATNELIDIHCHPSYGPKPYDPNDPDCLEFIEETRAKKDGKFYKSMMDTYTIQEPLKTEVARSLGLKRKVFTGYNAPYELREYLSVQKMQNIILSSLAFKGDIEPLMTPPNN